MHPVTHNGTVTVASPTGKHVTFRIHTQPEEDAFAPGQRVVSVLVGPNNEKDYEAFAFVNRKIRLFRKKRTARYVGFAKVLSHPKHYEAMGMEYRWAARCRVCGRKLTTPQSLKSGIGPVCQKRC
jgi:hypothetical protein